MYPRTAVIYFPFISWICHDYIDSFSEADVICYLGTRYQFLLSIWTRSNVTREWGVKRERGKKKVRWKSSLPLNQRYLQKSRWEQVNHSFHEYLCQNFQVTDTKIGTQSKLISISHLFHTQLCFVNNGAKLQCQFWEYDTKGLNFQGRESRSFWTLSMERKSKVENAKNYNHVLELGRQVLDWQAHLVSAF